jgi:hypothetical protein
MASKPKQRAEAIIRAQRGEEQVKDLRFWRAPKGQVHKAVFANVRRLEQFSRVRQAQDLQYACLYDDAELAGLIQGADAIELGIPQTMTTNICRRQVDSWVAKMLRNRPVPMAVTTGGNYSQQRRAKALTKFFEGVLDHVGYWKTRRLRLRDAAVFGSGLARNFRIGKELFHVRLLPWELRFDPLAAMKDVPRSIFIRHRLDRLISQERWPNQRALLEDAASRTDEDAWDVSLDRTSDMVVIEEAFHLPSGRGATKENPKDGAWAFCASNVDLAEGAYLRDYHPISKIDYSPGLFGWWGDSMVRQLAGLQYEVNSMGLRLQEQGFMTGSYVLVPDGSGIETDTLDNGALTVVRYQGAKPEWVTPAPWHPAFFDYYMQLRGQFAADITGMTGASTRGDSLPAGMVSGKAQRTFHEIADENLIPVGRDDEQDAIDTAWQFYDLLEEIHTGARGEDEFMARVHSREAGRDFNKDFRWSDVKMDRESFTLRAFPTNFLSNTPSDRWEQVSEMAEKGLFSQDEILSLLDFPDVQRVLNLRGSPRRAVEKIIEKILETGQGVVPEPTMNLDICVALGTLAYLEAKWIDEVDEKFTSPLLDFVLEARRMRDEPLEQQQEGAPTGPDGQPAFPDELEDPALVNGGVGPQPGSQDPMAPPEEAMPALGAPGPQDLYAPPPAMPMPGNAMAPEMMPPPGAV